MRKDFRSLLRELPVLKGDGPAFDPVLAPPEPVALFHEWLRRAVADGVLEPHAMTVSTVDEHGEPDSRVLIVKDVDDAGWHFAASAASPKGRQLTARPSAALTFHWPEQVRQVRVRGAVVPDDGSVRDADFRARSSGSRTAALTGRQSEPLDDVRELGAALVSAALRLADDRDLVPDDWTSYAVRPRSVEFWQGDPERRHRRLRYRRPDAGGSWTVETLWP